jgi:hypothetical protein
LSTQRFVTAEVLMLQRTAADDIAMAKRAGQRSLEAARQHRAANLRANRTLIVKISVAFVASMAAVLAALSTFANPNVIWFGAGMTFAGVCWLVAETLRGHEYRRLRDAAYGEEFTSSALAKMGSAGWTHIDCVEFDCFDIDHVAVGPGGVVAIETKWTNVAWREADGSLTHRHARLAVQQASRNALKIKQLLRGNAHIDIEVAAVLIIWGEGRPALTEPIVDETGVVVLTQPHLASYLQSLPPTTNADAINAISTALQTFVNNRDAYNAKQRTTAARLAINRT